MPLACALGRSGQYQSLLPKHQAGLNGIMWGQECGIVLLADQACLCIQSHWVCCQESFTEPTSIYAASITQGLQEEERCCLQQELQHQQTCAACNSSCAQHSGVSISISSDTVLSSGTHSLRAGI